jgi:hypothetical protein
VELSITSRTWYAPADLLIIAQPLKLAADLSITCVSDCTGIKSISQRSRAEIQVTGSFEVLRFSRVPEKLSGCNFFLHHKALLFGFTVVAKEHRRTDDWGKSPETRSARFTKDGYVGQHSPFILAALVSLG